MASLFLTLLLAAIWLIGAAPGLAQPALPGEPCLQAAPPTARTVTEVWVWIQICGGKIADLNRLLGDTLDPRLAEGMDRSA
jgi:hypothetical protein